MDNQTTRQSATEAVGALASPSLPLSEAGGEGTASADACAVGLREDILRRVKAEGLTERYPNFDLDAALSHPTLGALLRGEMQPTLCQLYEATHMEAIVESRVKGRLDAEIARALEVAVPEAVAAAVASAVAESEERLIGHIRARGQRPPENGTTASVGIRIHPAVDRLTRRERAMLAQRAERGETVRF